MTAQTTDRMVEGAKARLVSPSTGEQGTDELPAGFEFEVSDFCPALKRGDRGYGEPDYIQDDFYYGDANGGYNNVCVLADLCEQVLSADAMRARVVPTIDQFARAVSSELCGLDTDDFTTDETDYEGNGLTMIAGETREGLRFVAYVQVTTVYQADF